MRSTDRLPVRSGYAPGMEAHVFGDGALGADPVPLEELRTTVSDLADGEWLWVDAVDPSSDDLTTLQKQLDLHDLAVEDVQQRNQRPKVEIYPGHAFVVFRPLSSGQMAWPCPSSSSSSRIDSS